LNQTLLGWLLDEFEKVKVGMVFAGRTKRGDEEAERRESS